jgi:hypothetical protein
LTFSQNYGTVSNVIQPIIKIITKLSSIEKYEGISPPHCNSSWSFQFTLLSTFKPDVTLSQAFLAPSAVVGRDPRNITSDAHLGSAGALPDLRYYYPPMALHHRHQKQCTPLYR